MAASLASVLLACGFAGSAVAYTIMSAISFTRPTGLRPMHYATVAEETGNGGSQPITWKAYEHVSDAVGMSDTEIVAYAEAIRVHLSYRQRESEISVAAASKGFFGTFTRGLDAGRDFSSSGRHGHDVREIILSRHLAKSLFSNFSDALDHTLELNGRDFRVIGVAPADFGGLWTATDAWTPPNALISLDFGMISREQRGTGDHGSPILDNPDTWQRVAAFYVLAGSRTLSLERLTNELGALARSPENLQYHLHITDGLSKDPIRDLKIRFWTRLVVLLSVALIVAAGLNYCGLLLAQAPRHVEEVRLKRVLGASIARILLESMSGPVLTVLLAFAMAAVSSFALMYLFIRQMTDLLQLNSIPLRTTFVIFGIEFAGAFALAILIGLVPATRLLWDSGVPRTGYTSTSNRKANLALFAIVASQMASCILICLIALMIIRAVRSVSRVSLGFDAGRLAVVEVGPASSDTPMEFSTNGNGEFPLAAFTRQLIDNIQLKLRNAQYVGAASCAPFVQDMKTINIRRLDRELSFHSIRYCSVSQEFFRATGNPIVEGRGFSSSSLTGDVSEVVVNRELATELWPGETPLHRTVRIEDPALGLEFVAEVVGIAENMRFAGLTSTPDATIFLPLRGNVFTLSFPLYFLVKGIESPHSIEEFVRLQTALYMPSLGVATTYRVDDQLQRAFKEQNARVWFAAVGAALVTIIAYFGLYGVLVHFVNSKKKEMALRSCFGASTRDLQKIVIRQAVQCSISAIVISLLAWRPLVLLASSAWLGKLEPSSQSAVVIPLLCLAAAVFISIPPASKAANVSLSEILKEQ